MLVISVRVLPTSQIVQAEGAALKAHSHRASVIAGLDYWTATLCYTLSRLSVVRETHLRSLRQMPAKALMPCYSIK